MINILLIASYWIGNVIRLPIIDVVQLSPIDLIVGLLFIIHLPYLWRHRHIFRAQKLFRASLFLIIILISSLLVGSPLYSFQEMFVASLYIVRFIFFVSILFVPHRFSQKNIRILIGGFVIFGFLQYVLYPNLRYLLYLGWDDHYLRLFGGFLDPNFSGVMLVLMTIVLLCRPDGKKSELFDYVIALGSFFALLFTYSRSAYIVAIASAIAIAAVKKKFSYFLLLFLLLACGIMLVPKSLPTEGVDLLRTSSISARGEEYRKAMHIIKVNPFLGIGYNAYRFARTTYFGSDKSQFPSHSGAGVPNSYLFIFATSGIIGFIFFINWLGTLWDEYARRSLVAAPLLVAYMCSGFFDNTMVYPFILLWVLLMLKQTEFAHQPHTNNKSDKGIRKTK